MEYTKEELQGVHFRTQHGTGSTDYWFTVEDDELLVNWLNSNSKIGNTRYSIREVNSDIAGGLWVLNDKDTFYEIY